MPLTPVTMPERARMRRLREQGLPLEEIAELVGRSAPCVAIHTRDLGVQCRRGTKGLGAAGYARLLKLADEGMAHADLAERFGLKRSSIPVTISRLRRARRLNAASQEACAC
jgi:DNA-binding transcriptional MerR regulator